jgi:hypothetical protein
MAKQIYKIPIRVPKKRGKIRKTKGKDTTLKKYQNRRSRELNSKRVGLDQPP